jgi:hypothetical protein
MIHDRSEPPKEAAILGAILHGVQRNIFVVTIKESMIILRRFLA